MTPFRRRLLIAAAIPLVLLVALVIADRAIDGPLRGYLERQANARLQGYQARLGRVDLSLFNGSLDLFDVLLVQEAFPDPPVARIPRMTLSVQWRALLRGRIVADVAFHGPEIVADLRRLTTEYEDQVDLEDRGWQEAIEAIYPFKINTVRVFDGAFTYVGEGDDRPLRLSGVQFRAEDVRNVFSQPGVYPSPVLLDARVFEEGRLHVEGHADFLAQPNPGVRARFGAQRVDLGYFEPLLREFGLALTGGFLAAEGEVEYARQVKVVLIPRVEVQGARLEYAPEGGGEEVGEVAEEASEEAGEAVAEDDVLVDIGTIHLVDGALTYRQRDATPPWSVTVNRLELTLTGLSNRPERGDAVLEASGLLMGEGASSARAVIRPDPRGANLDLDVRVENAPMVPLNDLWRAYSGIDVAGGTFSVFTELRIAGNRIEGYVKPLFQDLDVYDRQQDRREGPLKKLKEKVVGLLSKVLENRPREEVATVTDISGPLEEPQTRTLQMVLNLVKNAFVKAILPGFEREARGGRRDRDERDGKGG